MFHNYKGWTSPPCRDGTEGFYFALQSIEITRTRKLSSGKRKSAKNKKRRQRIEMSSRNENMMRDVRVWRVRFYCENSRKTRLPTPPPGTNKFNSAEKNNRRTAWFFGKDPDLAFDTIQLPAYGVPFSLAHTRPYPLPVHLFFSRACKSLARLRAKPHPAHTEPHFSFLQGKRSPINAHTHYSYIIFGVFPLYWFSTTYSYYISYYDNIIYWITINIIFTWTKW